jgi:acyl-ACP thioesterase
MITKKQTHWYQKHQISLYEVDNFNKLRLDSVFDYLQEAASNNAELLGWGYNDLIKDELTWVLSRVILDLKVYKGVGEIIEVDTWPKGIDGILALRDYRLYDANENIIGLATSAWLLVNSKTMRPVKNDIFDLRVQKINPDSENAIEDTPGKILIPEKTEFAYERKIKYSDIDVNHHVNNAKYVQFILDCFEMNEFSGKEIRNIQINFLSELKYGDNVVINKGKADDEGMNIYVEGVKNNGKKVFQSLVKWQ